MITTLNIEKQITAFENKRIADLNIKPYHVSLYYCLLFKWNRQKDNPVFRITAREVMPMAKIGSERTYYRVLNDLLTWGYITEYGQQYKCSFVRMNILYTTITNEDPASYLKEEIDKEIEIDKQPNAPSLEEVIAIYTAAGLTTGDALNFHDYYQKKKWRSKDGKPIRFWQYMANIAIKRLLLKKTTSNDAPDKSKYQDPI